MVTKYEQIYDGEWFQPKRKGFKDQCCDCGLVHTIDFVIVDENKKQQPLPKGWAIQLRARRNNRATAAIRRNFKFEKR